MDTNANIEKTRRSKVGRGAATAANRGKVKRRLKHERHLSENKHKRRRVKRLKGVRVSKRLKNLLDGIPS